MANTVLQMRRLSLDSTGLEVLSQFCGNILLIWSIKDLTSYPCD